MRIVALLCYFSKLLYLVGLKKTLKPLEKKQKETSTLNRPQQKRGMGREQFLKSVFKHLGKNRH